MSVNGILIAQARWIKANRIGIFMNKNNGYLYISLQRSIIYR